MAANQQGEPLTIRTHLARVAALAAVITFGAGCGSNGDQTAAPPNATPTAASASPVAASSSPAPAVSSTPAVDPDAPVKMGATIHTANGSATATVYGYKQPVAKSAPRPDEQAGFVWGAADVKVCAKKTYPESISVSHNPWTLAYADDTQIEPSSTGYGSFPEPEYPWGDKVLAPGRCVRGWITFPVPGGKRPVAVEYAPEGQLVPPRWVVPKG